MLECRIIFAHNFICLVNEYETVIWYIYIIYMFLDVCVRVGASLCVCDLLHMFMCIRKFNLHYFLSNDKPL